MDLLRIEGSRQWDNRWGVSRQWDNRWGVSRQWDNRWGVSRGERFYGSSNSVSGSPDLSGPVLYRILPLSNFGGKPCRIYESRATPSGITGNNDELCRSLMCLTIFHRREALKLQIGHCQFLSVTTILS